MGDSDNMDSSPFKQLRQKFVEDLEEILECPVCLERLTESVVQCQKGHNICKICYECLKVKQCPSCKQSYNGTTNFLAQNLVSKFEEIKMALIDPNHINKAIVKNKMSVETQTCSPTFEQNLVPSCLLNHTNCASITGKNTIDDDVLCWTIVEKRNLRGNRNNGNENDIIKKAIIKSTKAKFPCKIGDCNKLLSLRYMVTHVKENHAEYFINAGMVHGKMYTKKWKIQYRPNSIFDQAIWIDNMGLFFVNIVISREGDFHGHVKLNNIPKKAENFRYSLNISKHGIFISYKGKVLSTQTTLEDVSKGLFIHSTSMNDLIKTPRSFDCVLRIKQRS